MLKVYAGEPGPVKRCRDSVPLGGLVGSGLHLAVVPDKAPCGGSGASAWAALSTASGLTVDKDFFRSAEKVRPDFRP